MLIEQKDETTLKDGDTKPAETVQTKPPAASSAQDAKPTTTTSAQEWALPSSTLPNDNFTTTSPTTTDIKDLDLDSMFEDFTNTSPQDLNATSAFDTNADQHAGDVFDTTTNFESGHTEGGGGDGTAADIGDVSSLLLRGIEGYANIPDNTGSTGNTVEQQVPTTQAQDAGNADEFDFSMLDLPVEGEQQQDGGAGLGESMFDELFDIGELGDGTADGGGLSDDFWKEFE